VKRAARKEDPRILVITGLSGSGKTHVARALEDVGWFCVDNLPTPLIPRFAELIRGSSELHRSALVVDMREEGFAQSFPDTLRNLKARGFRSASSSWRRRRRSCSAASARPGGRTRWR
jgi:UPF0042 nucleotide-binding protein